MGFPVELFVDEPDEEFICCVCDNVVEYPVMIDSGGGGCEHLACRYCITHGSSGADMISSHSSCPKDMKIIRALVPAPKVVTKCLNRLTLQCKFNKVGCKENPTVEKIREHESRCKFNSQIFGDCRGGCGAKVFAWGDGTHDCVDYMNTKIQQLTTENADLKKNCAAAYDIINLDKPSESTLIWEGKPGGIYGVCIYAHPGAGKLFLDLKLGDIVEIEKKNFGKNSHMAIKNGVKGLVGTSFLQLLTYEQLIAGFEVAYCVKSPAPLSPQMLSVPLMDTVQIICKDVVIPVPTNASHSSMVGWLANLHGKVGYVDPSHFQIM